MGTPDDGRPSGKRETPKPSNRPGSSPDSFPDSRLTITHRGPSSFTRVVAFGSWLLVFMLLIALLKGMNEWRLHKLKQEVEAMRPQPVPAAALEIPEPAAPPPEEPAPSVEMAQPAETPPAVPAHPPPAAEPVKKSATPQLAEVILSPSPNGNFYVKGEINGQAVVFVVDTGASAVSIPDKLRWKLGLTRGRYLQSATANGIAGMYEANVKNIAIGPLRFRDVTAVLYPNSPDDTVLLGMTALRDVRMEQQNGRMILQQLIVPDTDAETPGAAAAPKLTKPIKECMGDDKVVNARVLKCMQGADEKEAGDE